MKEIDRQDHQLILSPVQPPDSSALLLAVLLECTSDLTPLAPSPARIKSEEHLCDSLNVFALLTPTTVPIPCSIMFFLEHSCCLF